MAQDTREQIVAAARELVAERGYEGTSFAAIAQRLGVTKAAVAYHFHPKETLLAALLTPAARAVGALVARPAPTSPTERRQLALGYLDALLAHREVIAPLITDPRLLASPAVGTRVATLRDEVRRRLTGPREGDVATAWAVLGAVHIGVWRTLELDVDTVRPALVTAVARLLPD